MKKCYSAFSILLATVFAFSFILTSNASSSTSLNTLLQASSEEPISLIAPTNYVRPGDSITLVYSLYELICEEFSVNDPEIATVSESGVVTGISPGIVTVKIQAWDLPMQTVYEDTVDIIVCDMTGLVDGTSYFMSNSTGSYSIRVNSSGTGLYADLPSETGNPGFELDVWSDGRVSFKYGSSAITVASGALTLSPYTGAETQKFSIYRVWEGVSKGLYIIRYGTLYVGINEDDSLGLISHFCSTADVGCTEGIYWSVIKKSKGIATYVGLDCSYPGAELDSVVNINTFGRDFTSLGYTPNLLNTPSTANAFSALQNSSVYLYHGHANPGRLSLSNNSGWLDRIYAHSSLGSSPYAISDLNDNALANARCILYIGCFTALEDRGYSLLEESFKKGARAVYGSTHKLYSNSMNDFVVHFGTAVKNAGGNISAFSSLKTCMDNAVETLGSSVPMKPWGASDSSPVVYGFFPLVSVGDTYQPVGIS